MMDGVHVRAADALRRAVRQLAFGSANSFTGKSKATSFKVLFKASEKILPRARGERKNWTAFFSDHPTGSPQFQRLVSVTAAPVTVRIIVILMVTAPTEFVMD
jgi:hypothetical protein